MVILRNVCPRVARKLQNSRDVDQWFMEWYWAMCAGAFWSTFRALLLVIQCKPYHCTMKIHRRTILRRRSLITWWIFSISFINTATICTILHTCKHGSYCGGIYVILFDYILATTNRCIKYFTSWKTSTTNKNKHPFWKEIKITVRFHNCTVCFEVNF